MSAVAATPSPVSMTIVIPADRGAELRWPRSSSMTATSLQWLSSMAGPFGESMQRAFDHRQIGSPRDRHHLGVALDVELEQAALEHRRLVARTVDAPRAHLDARRLVAVVVAVGLPASVSAGPHPPAAPRGAAGGETGAPPPPCGPPPPGKGPGPPPGGGARPPAGAP